MKIIHKALFIALALTALVFSTNCDEKIDDLYIYFSRAISSGDIGRMENAIKHGADVNLYFKDGITPLIHAIQQNQIKSVKYLVKKGADVNKREKLHQHYQPLHKAIYKKNMKIIQYLVEHGANVNGKSGHGSTAFHHATVFGNLNIVKYLHLKGGNLSQNTLHFVHDLTIALYLIKNGVKVDDYSTIGATALHLAIISDDILYIKFLIKHGADVNKKTIKGGYTSLAIGKSYKPGTKPLKLAQICGHKDIIKLLKKHGAR